MNNYLPEDLLMYLYQDTDAEATAAIEEALQNSWTLREKLAVLKAAKERLNSIVETPRTEVVLSILQYANKTATVFPQ
jgi:hypothetical protein